MRTRKQILEAIADRKADAESIIALAESEDRELTAEESTAFDKITGVGTKPENYHYDRKVGIGNKDSSGYIAGEIDALEAELAQATKREQLKAKAMQTRIDNGGIQTTGHADDENPFARVRVPSSVRRPSRLKGFDGENSLREAYASAQFVAAVLGNEHSRSWCRDNGVDFSNVMKEGTDSLGGYTVPEPLEAAIISLVETYGIFRQFAGRKPMSAPTDSTPRRIGGLKVYYPDEGVAITKSDLRLGRVKLTATKYACLTEISTELNEDSLLDMISLLVMEMATAKAQAEDTNGFMGDGSAAFASTTGLASALKAICKVEASSADLTALTLGDYEKLEALLPEFVGIDPMWFVNKSVWGNSMAPLSRAAGGTTMSDIQSGRARREFLGYDVAVSQVLPKAPAAGEPIAFFGDLRMTSTLGTRRGMSFSTSTEGDFFTNDTIGVKCTQRIAIENHEVGTDAAAASGDQPAVLALPGPMVALFVAEE